MDSITLSIKNDVEAGRAINMFRGEFTGLNGGADLYASSFDEFCKEGEISLRTFLNMCA